MLAVEGYSGVGNLDINWRSKKSGCRVALAGVNDGVGGRRELSDSVRVGGSRRRCGVVGALSGLHYLPCDMTLPWQSCDHVI